MVAVRGERFRVLALALSGALLVAGAMAVVTRLAAERAVVASPAPVPGLAALPAAARGPVSAVLGRANPGYRVAGLRAVNPAQRLTIRFGSRGVAIASGGSQLSLRLAAFGRTNRLSALPPGFPISSANRVNYAHGSLEEWYVNGPWGVEQGFDVPRRPVGQGALKLAIVLSPGARARVKGSSALLTAGGLSLRYTGLEAIDAAGRSLPAWLAVAGQRLVIGVNDRGARYPLRIDPFVQQGSALVGTGASGSAAQGTSVALSADGTTALVGGPFDNQSTGAAWVFVRSGSTWKQQGAKLVGSNAIGAANEGVSVALSADGNTALIGGPGDNSTNGAVWVFTRSGTTWKQQGSKLLADDASSPSNEGHSVSLSADGNTALIGGSQDNGGVGGAWVFVRSSGIWKQQGSKLVGTGTTGGNAFQGNAVALSGDGSTAIVGGSADNNGNGAVWIFVRSNGAWKQQGPKLVGHGVSNTGNFGTSVALSSNGNTALVGGPSVANSQGEAQGAAWVFVRSSTGTWAQQGGMLVGTGGSSPPSEQGSSVALSATGNAALVGAPGGLHGGAWLFTRSGAKWTQLGPALVGSGASFGASEGTGVALSGAGTTALIGARLNNRGVGATWVFVWPPATTITAATIDPAGHTAKFSFTSTGQATGFQCALIKGSGSPSFTSCTSPKLYTKLSSAKYTFEVRALSANGVGPAAKRQFTI